GFGVLPNIIVMPTAGGTPPLGIRMALEQIPKYSGLGDIMQVWGAIPGSRPVGPEDSLAIPRIQSIGWNGLYTLGSNRIRLGEYRWRTGNYAWVEMLKSGFPVESSGAAGVALIMEQMIQHPDLFAPVDGVPLDIVAVASGGNFMPDVSETAYQNYERLGIKEWALGELNR
ncbi:MAG: hypothetical protein AABZ57_02560, partial [Candidatus Margulisiibacteriota bacterium]